MTVGLKRFVEAQSGGVYERALGELRNGQKESHWMWFIFPQVEGLGQSEISRFYAISGRAEAEAYLAHDLLGPRLLECTRAVLGWAGRRSTLRIFGSVDALKFGSSMTLFEACSDDPAPFAAALDAFALGRRDDATLDRI